MACSGGGCGHILITGVPGVGKTTLVRKITQHLVEEGKTVKGFFTLEKREGGTGGGGRRIGFDFVPVPEGTAGEWRWSFSLMTKFCFI